MWRAVFFPQVGTEFQAAARCHCTHLDACGVPHGQVHLPIVVQCCVFSSFDLIPFLSFLFLVVCFADGPAAGLAAGLVVFCSCSVCLSVCLFLFLLRCVVFVFRLVVFLLLDLLPGLLLGLLTGLFLVALCWSVCLFVCCLFFVVVVLLLLFTICEGRSFFFYKRSSFVDHF